MDQHSLAKLLDHLDAAPVECDGMTKLVVTLLDAAGIPHQAFVGRMHCGERTVNPHLWVEVGNLRIDYRARMWLGEDGAIPHGVFPVDQAGEVHYEGVEVVIEPLPPFLFEILQAPFPTPQSLGLR